MKCFWEVAVCGLSAGTLSYKAAAWGAGSRAVQGPKDREFGRDEGERSILLFKITHKRVQMESADRHVTSGLRQAGAERKILHEFQEKLLISSC